VLCVTPGSFVWPKWGSTSHARFQSYLTSQPHLTHIVMLSTRTHLKRMQPYRIRAVQKPCLPIPDCDSSSFKPKTPGTTLRTEDDTLNITLQYTWKETELSRCPTRIQTEKGLLASVYPSLIGWPCMSRHGTPIEGRRSCMQRSRKRFADMKSCMNNNSLQM
jgi:hypothetical protein